MTGRFQALTLDSNGDVSVRIGLPNGRDAYIPVSSDTKIGWRAGDTNLCGAIRLLQNWLPTTEITVVAQGDTVIFTET